jgi:hypothetical protein
MKTGASSSGEGAQSHSYTRPFEGGGLVKCHTHISGIGECAGEPMVRHLMASPIPTKGGFATLFARIPIGSRRKLREPCREL